jgi:RNA-binding protein
MESFKYRFTLTYLFFERGMSLQRLGRVQKVTPSENIIVKADIAPKLGLEVVDENLKVVGKIFDVIGPVSAPYAVIKPSISDPAKLTNKQLYLLLSRNRGPR